jgi:hypothetical protein
MITKWIDGQLYHKNEFRYIATAIRRTVPRLTFRSRPVSRARAPQLEFEFYDSKPTVRRFELRKDAEKWLSYEKMWGAFTKLEVSRQWLKGW